MGYIQDSIRKWREKKEAMKEAQHGRRMQKAIEERELSSEERELMDYQRREREQAIKRALVPHRKKLQQDVMYGGYKAHEVKNVIKNQPNIFSGQGNLLKAKNLFMKGGSD